MKTDTSPRIRAYLKQVSRNLKLSRDLKQRICSDLSTTIALKLEVGIPEETILQELGRPEDVAADFNVQMAENRPSKSPLRFLCLAAAVFSALVLIGKLVLHFLVTDFFNGMTHSIGIIGGADGPTSVFVSTTVSERFDGGLFFWLFVLIAGIAGFYLLNRRNNKEDEG